MKNNLANGVTIVGAGIAGSALAVALASRGVDVTVIEKQSEWKFQSSGIFIYSNGLVALSKVGVLPAILQAGFVVADGKNIYLDQDGEPIVDVFYPSAENGAVPPVIGIKRAEMHRVLAKKMQDLGVQVKLGTTVESFEDRTNEGPVLVRCSDGSTISCDLLVGADGVRSDIRTQCFGPIIPTYTGFGVWRSIHRRPPELIAKLLMMGVGKRLGAMPISQDTLYVYATSNEPGRPWYEPTQWHALMREKFDEFQGPARQFLDELSPATETLYTSVEEVHLPLPWHKGRVQLIGDAAHASTPFMGQGGAMALEDAVVLAEMLFEDADIKTILARFGKRRYPRCSFVQDVSRKVGEAGGLENDASCIVRNQSMRENAQADVDRFYRMMLADF